LKILLYAIDFAPELTSTGRYTAEMAAWLVAAGHHVRVVTAPPYYPEWRVWGGYHATRYSREVWRGVTVLRSPLWVPRQASGLKRLLHLASFALASIPVLVAQLRWKPDVLWLVEPPLFCAPAGLVFARLSGAKAWLHVQDYEVDAAFAMGLLRGKLLRRWAAAGERWLMRRFDRVSTISSRMLERAAAKGVEAGRLVSFPNWVDISTIVPLSDLSPFRAELGISPGAMVALYSGNMGAKQGLEVLAAVAALLKAELGLAFVFCGDGPGKADLVRRCQGLSNVRFLSLQPTERLNDLLGLADIHLLPQREDAADLVMPSKLTGILASGRPVIATAARGTELAQVVGGKAPCGEIVPPENAAALAAAIQGLLADPARRAAMGTTGRAYAVRELDRDNVLRRFELDLQACLAEKKGPG
jgi:colanic acid biosynthesis glycosyl transferase WcaI